MTPLRARREEQFSTAGVYPVITPEFCAGRDPVWVAQELVAAGARVIQLRVKSQPDGVFYDLAVEFRRITADAGCLLIVNDRPDLALAVDADGVHVGQGDLPVAVVRRLLPDALVNLSTHHREELLAAQREDVSCVNIGPIYATGTKVNPMAPLGVDALRELVPLVRVPFSVMGGIKEPHLPGLVAVGVQVVAMVTQLTQAEHPGEVFSRMQAVLRGQ